MEEIVYANEEEMKKESFDDDDPEEGFMKGYEEEGEVEECAECGGAVKTEKKVTKEIDGEDHVFCSESCAKEFEESLGKKE